MKKYIDLSSDPGFKMTFGDPDCPELILGLLRNLIPEREITSIEFLNTESFGEEDEKTTRFDILCHEPDGAYFVVEMQKNKYDYFTDRLVVYAGSPLKHLLKKGEDYTFVKPLYIVSILDYVLRLPGESEEDSRRLVRRSRLCMEDTGAVLSNKLNYIFLQMPLIRNLVGGEAFLEKWSYAVRNMSGFEERPRELEGAYFDRLFERSDRENIRKDKLSKYDKMLRDEIQIEAEKRCAVREAREEGLAQGHANGLAEGLAQGQKQGLKQGLEQGQKQGLKQGLEQGQRESARNFKSLGVDIEIICKATGLSKEQVEAL